MCRYVAFGSQNARVKVAVAVEPAVAEKDDEVEISFFGSYCTRVNNFSLKRLYVHARTWHVQTNRIGRHVKRVVLGDI